jgi:hypothetical protein
VRGGPDAGTPDVVGGVPDEGASEGGGHDDDRAPGAGRLVPSWGALVRARLYSRQHVGHLHSRTSEPSGPLNRVSRHPNWALMRV